MDKDIAAKAVDYVTGQLTICRWRILLGLIILVHDSYSNCGLVGNIFIWGVTERTMVHKSQICFQLMSSFVIFLLNGLCFGLSLDLDTSRVSLVSLTY